MRSKAMVAGVVAGVLAVGGVAAAAGEDDALNLCVKRGHGDLRAVGSASDCKGNETFVKFDPRGQKGDPGPAGPAGPKGADGAIGPAGPAGKDGATGPAGEDGATGPAGQDGADGATGPAGEDGATGADGAAGPAGKDGAAGAKGDKGDAGPAGPEGPAGPPGPAGTGGSGSGSGTTVLSVDKQTNNVLFENGDGSENGRNLEFTVAGPTLPEGNWLVEATVGVEEYREDSAGTVTCALSPVVNRRQPQFAKSYAPNELLYMDYGAFPLAYHVTAPAGGRATSVKCEYLQNEPTYGGFKLPVTITATKL